MPGTRSTCSFSISPVYVAEALIGVILVQVCVNYSKLAEGYGMQSEGPIEDPAMLAAALKRGVESVKSGKPYLIDVVTQPR